MYLFTTPNLPTISLPSRERLQRVWSASITALLWAIAITYTACKLTRRGWEAIRPGLARALHALALLLDGGLAYPDQPEPDPTPDPEARPTHIKITPSPEMLAVIRHIHAGGAPQEPAPLAPEAPARSIFDGAIDRVITASKVPVASRPARRRTTAKAAVKAA